MIGSLLTNDQINLQYITQLLQSSDFDIEEFQIRKNLLNSDDLEMKDILALFRQFQSHLKQGHNRNAMTKLKSKVSDENRILQPLVMQKQIQGEKNTQFNIQSPQLNKMKGNIDNNKDNNQFNNQLSIHDGLNINYLLDNQSSNRQQSIKKENDDLIRIEIDEYDVIEFPQLIQKYPFKQSQLFLKSKESQVSMNIMRRIAFLSVSGCIGFDDNERIEIIKGAFLLEFDSFFYFLTKAIGTSFLQFKENADEVIEILTFMWQTDMRKSMKYYDFITMLALNNPYWYKRNMEISPLVLKLEVSLVESQLLPLIQRQLSSQQFMNSKQIRLTLQEIVDYYQIHAGKKIYYLFLSQSIEKEAVSLVENRFSQIVKEFECPICFQFFTNCYTTKCGHSFCKKCIEDSVKVLKRCPVCLKKMTSREDLFRNFHLTEIQSLHFQCPT